MNWEAISKRQSIVKRIKEEYSKEHPEEGFRKEVIKRAEDKNIDLSCYLEEDERTIRKIFQKAPYLTKANVRRPGRCLSFKNILMFTVLVARNYEDALDLLKISGHTITPKRDIEQAKVDVALKVVFEAEEISDCYERYERFLEIMDYSIRP